MNSEDGNGQSALLERVRTTLRKPDTVILVGSGVSRWSGLPSWQKLIVELADYLDELGRLSASVRDAADQKDLLLAASYGVHQLSKTEFAKFIRNACRVGTAEPHEIHSLICELGPTSYITTNYDKLLETALAASGLAKSPLIVTSRQVTEIPEILKSSSSNFVFKYHGDVDDSDGVILSQDQYAKLQGAFTYVAKSIEAILTTRPVVMIGFGLRDPDFLAIKDLLQAAFGGGFGEHFAIIPDVDEVARRYWREVYSVEILTYRTVKRTDGTTDHTAILDLLRLLSPAGGALAEPPADPDLLLRLGRYATRLKRARPDGDPLPLTIERLGKSGSTHYRIPKLLELLLSETISFVLLGKAGAGKSYTLRHFIADLGEDLIEQCLTEPTADNIQEPPLLIPFAADLALYRGSIFDQLVDELPVGVDLAATLTRFQATILLDAANEMPEHFIETGAFTEDLLSFQARFPGCRLIIAGRAGGWTDKIEFPFFELQAIDWTYVVDSFRRIRKVDLEGRYDLIETLSTPLFFQICSSPSINLDLASTPSDVHCALVRRLEKQWQKKHTQNINLESLFGQIAFGMLSNGVEYFSIDSIAQAFAGNMAVEDRQDEIINFLVGENFLHPVTDRRLSFFHQSITEYFASATLAERYSVAPNVLKECLQYRRWDYAVFLTLSRLPPREASKFFDQILHADFLAAVRAINHVKEGRTAFIEAVLTARLDKIELTDSAHFFEIEFKVAQLPFESVHIEQLECLAQEHSISGGAAAGTIASLDHNRRKEMVARLADQSYGYNYVSTLAEKLADAVTVDEIEHLLLCISQIPIADDDVLSAASIICREMSATCLMEVCSRHMDDGEAVRSFFAHVLQNVHTLDSLDQMITLVQRGVLEPAGSIYFLIRGLVGNDLIPPATNDFATQLIDLANKLDEDSRWAAESLVKLQMASTEWRELLAQRSDSLPTAFRLALEFYEADDPVAILNVCSKILSSMDDWSDEKIGLVMFDPERWLALPEPMICELIAKRRIPIVGDFATHVFTLDNPIDVFSLQPAVWWLDWILELAQDPAESGYVHVLNLISALADNKAFRQEVISRLQERDTLEYDFLLCIVAPRIGVTTDDLNAAAIKKLIGQSDLKTGFGDSVLGTLATDEFAETVILPAWQKCGEGERKRDLEIALEVAGRRHNRRYELKCANGAL